MLTVIITVLTALVFSAFFSGMELAFTGSNKLKLEIEKKQNKVFNYIASIFLRNPGQYITTILVGNNIALVVYSLNMSLLISLVLKNTGWNPGSVSILLDTLISTVIIIFTAEFIPKAIVKLNPNFYLRIFAVPVYVFYVILYPVAMFSTWISLLVLRLFGMKVRNENHIKVFDKVDLAHMLEDNEGSETDMGNEIKLFQNALDFSDLRVRDCMVPRVDIEAVEVGSTIEELSQKFIESKFSRLFVYEETIDNIVGYVNSKSLFTSPQNIAQIMMQVDVVPETLECQQLLADFIRKKSYIAVVLDEFGGTAGIVSLEDILEEIFGEIEDEHDSPDLLEKRLGDGEWIFSCRQEVKYLNEKYGLGLEESDDYDTLAGYIISHFDGIPPVGETITVDNKSIRIVKSSSSRLDVAKIKIG